MSNMQSFYGRETAGTKTAQLQSSAPGYGQSSLSPAPFGVCPGPAGSQQRFSLFNQSRSVTPNPLHQSSQSSSAFFNFYQSTSAHSPPNNAPARAGMPAGQAAINGLSSPTMAASFQSAINRTNASGYFGQPASAPVLGGSPSRSVPAAAMGCFMPSAGPQRDGLGFQPSKYLESSAAGGGQAAPGGGGLYGQVVGGGMGRFPTGAGQPPGGGGAGGVGAGQMMFKRLYGNGPNQTPLGLSESDFPCLTIGTGQQQHHVQTIGPQQSGQHGMRGHGGSGRGYGTGGGGATKPPATANSQPEFQIENEDFPALPGCEEPKVSTTSAGSTATTTTVSGGNVGGDATEPTAAVKASQAGAASLGTDAKSAAAGVTEAKENKGVYLLPDGSLGGLSPTMLRDQFGMAGMVVFLKSTHKDQAMISLLLGHDLMHLGVNLNSPEKYLHPSFGGPWSEAVPVGMDTPWRLPPEYLTCMPSDGDPQSVVKMNRVSEELLFWMFYYCGGETYQLSAAAELYQRDWRYHKQDKVWLTRAPGTVPTEKTTTYERGAYFVFDPVTWRKVGKEMLLEYGKLEDHASQPYAGRMFPPVQSQLEL